MSRLMQGLFFAKRRPDPRRLRFRTVAVLLALLLFYGSHRLQPEVFDLGNARLVDWVARLGKGAPDRPTGEKKPSVITVDSIFYFDRSHHAKVIRNLAAMRVAAQVTDFIFENKVDDREDGALIDAALQAHNVYFGMAFTALSTSKALPPLPASPQEDQYLRETEWPLFLEGPPDSLLAGHGPKITYPELAKASRGLGFINVTPDDDGVVRRVPLLVRLGDAFYPSLAFRVVLDYLGISYKNIRIEPGEDICIENARLGDGQPERDLVIPIDIHGNMFLNFDAVPSQEKKYSYREIIQATEGSATRETLSGELAGNIVILSETVEKPFRIRTARPDPSFPLATIHKTVARNIIDGTFLRPLPRLVGVVLGAFLVGLLFLLSLRLTSPPLLAGGLLITGAYVIAGGYAFLAARWIFPFVPIIVLLLCTLAALLIAAAVEGAMIAAETERARRQAERELEIGREIQGGFFPTTLPGITGWEVETYFNAARHVSGDFYDIFTLGKRNRLGIVTADVCDKGVGAALFMALFRSMIRALSGKAVRENFLENASDSPAILRRTIQSVNNYISITHGEASMFATVFYGLLDPQTGELHYINGGHEPAVIVSAGGIKATLVPTGPAVGMQPDMEYTVGRTGMAPGDTLVVFTDGVIDSLDRSGRRFSKHRLHELLRQPADSAQELIGRVRDQVDAHTEGVEQFDDLTVTVVRRVA